MKRLKKEAVESQRKPLGWYRKNGLQALMWCVLSWATAFANARLAVAHPELKPLFKPICYALAGGGGIMFLLGNLCLFTWFTLRNDPEFK